MPPPGVFPYLRLRPDGAWLGAPPIGSAGVRFAGAAVAKYNRGMKILGIAGFSGSGKTTLIEALIPLLGLHGLVVSVIKRAHHGFDVDRPGKDSWRHRQAGAQEVMLASPERWVLMRELRRDPEENLAALLAHLSPCDLVLIEGFKSSPIPKIEVFRPSHGKPPLFGQFPQVLAVACDGPCDAPLPLLDLNDPDAIAEFVVGLLPGLPETPLDPPL